MRKTFTMLLFSMTAILPMTAQSDKSMVVETKNSGTQQFNLSDIRRLDFSNEGVSVVSVDKDGATFAFDDIKKITFGSATNGISQIKTEGAPGQSIFISSDGNDLTIKGWNPSVYADLSIFTVGGAQLLNEERWNGQPVNISSLPKGVYVVRVGKRTGKFRK